jgi:hypothetical protein
LHRSIRQHLGYRALRFIEVQDGAQDHHSGACNGEKEGVRLDWT